MIHSMTGFGSASRSVEGYRLTVDMKSVNHRYCEIAVRMPREWLAQEDSLKKRVQRLVKRGRVDVFVQIEPDSASGRVVDVDWALADGIWQAGSLLRERFGMRDDDPLSLRDFLAVPGLIRLSEASPPSQEWMGEELLECADEALQKLIGMRQTEGRHLQADLSAKLEVLRRIRSEIAMLAPQVTDSYRVKLRGRIEELLTDASVLDEQRLAMEVALFADRANVDEELTRLASHLAQFGELLNEREPVGRKLDFLVQEMNREANTIGSKANHAEMAALVVELKAELEKIREQAQNIE